MVNIPDESANVLYKIAIPDEFITPLHEIAQPVLNYLQNQDPSGKYRARVIGGRESRTLVVGVQVRKHGPNLWRKIFPKEIARIYWMQDLSGSGFGGESFNKELLPEETLDEFISELDKGIEKCKCSTSRGV